MRLGELEKAQEIIEHVDLEKLTGEARVKAANNLSLLYWKSGDLPKAIEVLETLFASNEKSTSLYGNLTYYYILHEDYDKALELAKESFAYNEKDIVILENLARIQHLTGDMEQAKVNYAKLEALKPTYPEAWYNLALFYEEINEKEKAAEALNTGLKCNFTYLSNVTREQFESKLKSPATVSE